MTSIALINNIPLIFITIIFCLPLLYQLADRIFNIFPVLSSRGFFRYTLLHGQGIWYKILMIIVQPVGSSQVRFSLLYTSFVDLARDELSFSILNIEIDSAGVSL